ncbi:MAG: M99 family carboxypeptidase catalytic domain-containing protein [Candidatus Aminicenantaceae bacterium]
MKKSLSIVFVCLLAIGKTVFASGHLDFTLHKLESGQPGATVLVVGGIQGDEPGGFNAASLLVTNYKIRKGNVWVVPNLNFISIIKRTRGVHGDLNRKFASIKRTDPELDTIEKIKAIILNDEVDVILNLHDGSGFYRPHYIDRMHNPRRWGQSIIIDQERIETERFGNLCGVASQAAANVNNNLYSEEHTYHVKNTRTGMGDEEMSKTLTYFAIRNLKPAFGVEVSKSFMTPKRVYYHLQVIESYMDLFGIEYERGFKLSESSIRKAIKSDRKLAFYDRRIFLDVADARKLLRYMPFKKGSEIIFTGSNPLMAIVGSGKSHRVYHGNARLTRIHSQYFEYDSSINSITMLVDSEEKKVNFGEMVDVDKSFLVVPREGYRVNVIGFKKTGVRNESGIPIGKSDIQKRFSVDKKGRTYRVEVYLKKKFSGMVLVNFGLKSDNRLALGR